MNGIDDLRSTLDRHADDVVGQTAVVRRAAVHHRVGVVKRRRRAAVAGGAAAVVAVVGGIAALPSGTDRTDAAGPTVFGVDIPDTIDSLGFEYDYAEHVSARGKAVIDLGDSDAPRLISWGTSGDDDRVTVSQPWADDSLVHDGADFSDFTYVPRGDGTRVTARVAEGEVAIAVYTLGDGRPDGVTAHGVTFRDSRADAPLLGAAVGDPGEAEITVEPTERAESVFYTYYCTGGPANAYLHIETGDGGYVADGNCDDDIAPVDPAAGGGLGSPVRAGDDLTTRLRVTAGRDGPPVDDPDLRIGLGLYAEPETRRLENGSLLEESIELDGHLWSLDTSVVPDVAPEGAVVEVPEGEGRVVAVIDFSRTGDAGVTYEVDGDDSRSVSQGGGAGTFTVQLGVGADTVGLVRARGAELTDRTRVGVGFYVRAD